MSKILMISADCHAGALPATYEEYLPQRFRADARRWWAAFARELLGRSGTFFDQEAVEAYQQDAGDTRGLFGARFCAAGRLARAARRFGAGADCTLFNVVCSSSSAPDIDAENSTVSCFQSARRSRACSLICCEYSISRLLMRAPESAAESDSPSRKAV